MPSLDHRLDRLPQRDPAARVEPGRRLVQEDHRRLGDQRRREVEAPAHAARVRLDEPVARLVELEPVEQRARPLGRALLAEVVEAADHLQVLEAGQVLVDRGVLPRQADLSPQRRRVVTDVEAHHARRAGGGREERGQDPDRGRLAGAVRAEQAEHRPALDAQVDSAERFDVLVRLGEALGLDCEFFSHERFNLARGPAGLVKIRAKQFANVSDRLPPGDSKS